MGFEYTDKEKRVFNWIYKRPLFPEVWKGEDEMGEVTQTDLAVAQDLTLMTQRSDLAEHFRELPRICEALKTARVPEDEEEFGRLSDLVAEGQRRWRAMEKIRKYHVAPFLRGKQSIDAAFKPYKEDWEIAKGQGKLLQRKYNEFKRKELEERQRKAYEEELRRAREEGEGVASVEPPKEVDKIPTVRTETGASVYEVEVVRYEIVDAEKLLKAALNGRNKVPKQLVNWKECFRLGYLKQLIHARKLTDRQWRAAGVKVWVEKETRTRS